MHPSTPLAAEDPLSATLEHEVLAEKAATYGRLLEKLEKALARLRDFDFAHGDSTRSDLPLTADPPAARAGLREGGLTGRRAFALASLRSDGEPSDGSNMRPQEARSDRRSRQGSKKEARSAAGATGKKKEQLLNQAGQALWYVMIQRDLCGFRRHDLFMKEYNVPAAVRLRMGRVR